MIVDSPLAVDATTVFEMHPEVFDDTEPMVQRVPRLFRFDLLVYTRDAEDPKRLNEAHGPVVIIAGSGTAVSGRIVHHLQHGVGDPRNTVLIVGFQAKQLAGLGYEVTAPTLGDTVSQADTGGA